MNNLGKIKRLLNTNFNKIIRDVYKLSNNTEIMYHKRRKELNLNSLDGYNHCGPFCFTIFSLLKNNNINVDVNYSYFGYKKHLEDHTYLSITYNNKKIIIDPTYKQFMRDIRGVKDKYQDTLYDKFENIYIGNKINLFYDFSNMKILNQKVYNDYNISLKNYIDELKYFYDNPINYNDKYNEYYEKYKKYGTV